MDKPLKTRDQREECATEALIKNTARAIDDAVTSLRQEREDRIEELERQLRSLIGYCEWQINDGTDYHPTLPSAVSAAKNALSD